MKTLVVISVLTGWLVSPGWCQLVDLGGRWKFNIGDRAEWVAKAYDDSEWETMWVTSKWEEEGFYGYDGFAWYRKEFDGSKLPRNEKVYLNLGYIDDADEVYLNGELIGFSGAMPPKYRTAYNAERNYLIPTHLLNYSGKNTLAVRVFDATHYGGIISGDLGIYAVESRPLMVLDLNGLWDFALSRNGQPITDDDDWEKIMLPIPWEKQDFRHHDGLPGLELPLNCRKGKVKKT